jgi:hypothetical protein
MGSVESPGGTRAFLPPPVETPPTRLGHRRKAGRSGLSALFTLSVLGVYLVMALVAFWPVRPGSTSRLFGTGQDPAQMVWFLGWVAHALVHGQNPFFSGAVLLPHGVNIAENTSVPLLGTLAAPITLTLGPVAAANFLMVLAFPASASASFIVLRKWHVWGPAAAIGGLMYGFSPYMVGQGLGHLNLVFLPLPPFIAQAIVAIVQEQGPPLRLGAILGALIAAQFLISPEVLATMALLIVFALLCTAVRYRARLLTSTRSLLAPICVAAAVAGAVAAYPLWMMFAGPQHFPGAVQGARNPYHNDLLSFVVPGPLQRASLGMRALGDRLLGGNPAESGGYLGIPLLVVAAALAVGSCRSFRMQLAVLLVVAAALLSLGPYLAVDGHLTHVPLPDLLLTKVPLLKGALASRISFEVDACVAAVVAFGLDDLRRARRRRAASDRVAWRRATVASVVVAVALVAAQLPQWPYSSGPGLAFPTTVRDIIPPDDPVAITYPYTGPHDSEPMGWQAVDGFKFRLLGGYASHPGSSGQVSEWPGVMNPRGLQQFLAAGTPPSIFGPPLKVNSQLVAATRETLANYDVRLVIVDRSVANSADVVKLFARAIGYAQRSIGQFAVWVNGHRAL